MSCFHTRYYLVIIIHHTIPYIWKFLLWFLFRELRKSQKLDTQNFRYSKFLVPYKFIQLIQLHVSIAAGRWIIFVVSFWLSFESTLRSSKYRFYSIVPGCPTPRCPPNPRGPLSRAVPSPAITAANKEIRQLTAKSSKRGHYHRRTANTRNPYSTTIVSAHVADHTLRKLREGSGQL